MLKIVDCGNLETNEVDKMNDELIHYGILGMKWGVRRYQNPDGSLTSAGKKRYSSTSEKTNAKIKLIKDRTKLREQKAEAKLRLRIQKAKLREQKNLEKIQKRKSKLIKKEELHNMSDEELRKRINRMNMEQQYSDLSSRRVSKGKANVSKTLQIAGAALAAASSALAIALTIKQMRSKDDASEAVKKKLKEESKQLQGYRSIAKSGSEMSGHLKRLTDGR